MPIVRMLAILLALVAPALAQAHADAQDGPHAAASAADAAQALRAYVDATTKSGARPDFTKPPASDLFRQVFDLDALAALPPSRASDVAWLLDWGDAAKETNKMIMFRGTTFGPHYDPVVLQRNLTDSEDQYAASTSFLIRLAAREIPAMLQFMEQLAPEQRTPVRQAGLAKFRASMAGMLSYALCPAAQGMKPANLRLVTAAIADTRDAWAPFIAANARAQIAAALAQLGQTASDDAVKQDITVATAALTAAK